MAVITRGTTQAGLKRLTFLGWKKYAYTEKGLES